MICRHCGAELAQGATFCVRCGQPTGVAQQTSGPGAPTVQQRPQQGCVLPSVPMSAPPASVPPHARQGASQRGSGRSAYLFVIALSAVLIVAAAVVAALFATGVIGNGGGSQVEEVSESSGDDAVETGGGDAAELDDEDARAATAVVEDLNDMFDELLANGLSDDDVTEFGYDVMTLMPSSFVESIIERELEGDADQFALAIGGNTASQQIAAGSTASLNANGFTRTGPFNQSVCFPERVEERDWFGGNPYTYYSGGDYSLATMTNHKNPNGPKVVLLRESFSCALAPFLALSCSELTTIDLRSFSGDLTETIRALDPDLVITLYTASTTKLDNMFEFCKTE